NGVGFSESLVHAGGSNQAAYGYRRGMGMVPSAEWVVFFEECNKLVSSNVPSGWQGVVIDTGATISSGTLTGAAHGVWVFDSDGAGEGAATWLPKTTLFQTGKRWMMEVRAYAEKADDIDLQFGLSDLTATSNPEDLWTTTAASLVSFGVLDGSAVTGM